MTPCATLQVRGWKWEDWTDEPVAKELVQGDLMYLDDLYHFLGRWDLYTKYGMYLN